MTPPACDPLLPDSSVYFVSVNTTYALYSCRSGYRYLGGDYNRSCDASGNWTGQALQCTVDSVMPKTYLVILIVGATIAIFVACIPYDFYRYRKRKKIVRDHQERLSLVTRIAPSHATVILDTNADATKPAPEPPRKFGLKSLFSVFRFVGGKMKAERAAADEESKNNAKCENGKGRSIVEEGSSDGACGAASGSGGSGGSGMATASGGSNENGKGGGGAGGSGDTTEKSYSFSSGDGCVVKADVPIASSLLLDTHHSRGCPRSGADVIDLCDHSSYSYCDNQSRLTSDETSDDFDDSHLLEKGREDASMTSSTGSSSCSISNGKIIPNTNNSGSTSRSTTPPNHSTTPSTTSINSTAFRNAVKKSNSNSNSNSSLASRKSKTPLLSKSVSDIKISGENLNLNRSADKISNYNYSNPATVDVTPISSSKSSPSASSSKINGDPNFPVYLPPPPLPSSSSLATAGSSSASSSSSPNLCHHERREDRSSPRTMFPFHVLQAGTGGGVSGGSGTATGTGTGTTNPYHSMPTIPDVL